MADRHSRGHVDRPVAPDLVEYLVVMVPEPDSLTALAAALGELVDSAVIRVLDLVGLVRNADGTLAKVEIDIDGNRSPAAVDTGAGVALSDHDIGLAALALPPGAAGIVVLTESRWAEPLGAAARLAGGQIVAGERIPSARVEAALAEAEAEAKAENRRRA